MPVEYAVILATSNSSHVSGLTKSRPHAMLPALGKPMVVRVMNQLLQAGIKKFVVVVGINEGSVASYLNTHWVPNVELGFVLKSDYESLSTTLAQIARKLNQPFFVINYNLFVQPQFFSQALELAERKSEYSILTVTRSTLSRIKHTAFVTVKDDVVTDIGSMPSDDMTSSYLIAHMVLCGEDLVTFLQEMPAKIGRGSVHQTLIDILQIYAESPDCKLLVKETSWILQVRNDPDLMFLNYQLLEDGRDAHILSELPASVQIYYPVRIDPGVSIGQDAVIGPYVYLEKGAAIGRGTKISRSLVLENAFVPSNTEIYHVVIAPNKIMSIQID